MMAITFNGFNARTSSLNPFEGLGRNRNFIIVMGSLVFYTIIRCLPASYVEKMARQFAAATNGEIRVLLEHKPKYADENFARHGVRLQLSGHTHGGIAPGLDRIVALFNAGYVRGVYALPGGFLHVSPGVGQWAGFPLRFANPPEISVIVLRRAGHGKEKQKK